MDMDKRFPMLLPVVEGASVSILANAGNYNHDLMNIPAAWSTTYGEGVCVAVLDTGMPTHRDIRVKEAISCVPGYLTDLNGHGTHVAGIIKAGFGKTSDSLTGIAPACELICVAVLDGAGSGALNDLVRGIAAAVDKGANIINMSLGFSTGHIPALEQACNKAVAAGCAIFAAAGNDGIRGVSQPACYDSVIAVAAVNSARQYARFSNRGGEIDLAAGGVDVYSTWLDDGYKRLSGTSMACPAVAACAALVLSSHKLRGEKLTPDELREHLTRTAYDVGPDGFDEFSGNGIPLFKPSSAAASAKQTLWNRLTRMWR